MLTRISIGDAELSTQVRGEGDPLLLIHGFPLNHAMWEAQLESLSRTCRVIAPDLRGWGDSDRGSEEISMAQAARDLDRLAAALVGDQPIQVGGLSMGGYVAFEMVRQFPQRVSRLILADTRAIADDASTARARRITAASIREKGVVSLAADMPAKLLHPFTMESKPEVLRSLRRMIEMANPEIVAEYLEAMARRRSSEDLLGQISVPTLVVCGSHDVISTPTEMRQIASRIATASFELIEGAGHLPPMEQPGPFNQIVNAFLTG